MDFFDEKHLVNMDTLNGKVQVNPLTGRVDSIGVSEDFRETYNLIASISVNPRKGRSMVFTMGKKWNGHRFYESNQESHHFWLVDDW
jgi:hypothetical protein